MSFWKNLFGGGSKPKPAAAAPVTSNQSSPPIKAPLTKPATPAPAADIILSGKSEDERKAMYSEINSVLYDTDAMVADLAAGFEKTLTDRAADRAAKHMMRSYGLSLAEIQSLLAEGSRKQWPGPK
jgi:hypothetical protein